MLEDPLGEGGGFGGGEVDVGFVDDDEAVPGRVGEEGGDVGFREEGAGGVAWGAEVEKFDGGGFRGGGEEGEDGGEVEGEGRGGEERDFDEGDVVDLRGDRVHAVGRGADEDAVEPRAAEGAEEGVDGFVGADAEEEVGGGQGEGAVRVGVAEGAEGGFEGRLVGVGVAVEGVEVEGWAGAVAGGDGGGGEGRAVGVFVGVEEDVGAVVLVVAGGGLVLGAYRGKGGTHSRAQR